MTNRELAEACLKAGQCGRCRDPKVKAACLQNECWKHDYPKDNACPAVYYGLLPEMPDRYPEETEGWRRRWFAEHGLPYQPRPWPVSAP